MRGIDVDGRSSANGAVAALESPYPLARHFYARLLPIAAVALAAVVAVIAFTVKSSTENAYLAHATRVAENIGADVAKKASEPWQRLLRGDELTTADLDALVVAFTAEQTEYRLSGLKVYDLGGRTLYSSDPADIGDVESNRTLRAVIDSGKAGVVRHDEADGTETFELYVPFGGGGRPQAVFELYESVTGGLQKSIQDALWPVVGTLTALLALALVLLVPVIRRAQEAITARTTAIVEMRQRLERLVSRQAVDAARTGEFSNERRVARLELALLFADARDFTTFCEGAPPEVAVDVLNRLISAEVEEIERHGGDVDKIIGDGILARFDGPDRRQQAIKAAQAIQRRLASSDLPLRVGIGLYSGPVVAGLLGSEGRLDFTIIGDSVNVAARLCAAALAGEVVADDATLVAAGAEGFGHAGTISLKGRAHPVAVRRWAFAGVTPAID